MRKSATEKARAAGKTVDSVIITDFQSGPERWAADTSQHIDLDKWYTPYAKQNLFHESPARYKGYGGGAGPGKTAALIMDQVLSCYEHEGQDALKVETLLLRRTHKQLTTSLIPRFRQLVDPSLYRKATLEGSKKYVIWLTGARTHFGSAHREKEIWNYQGGEFKEVGFDEATQFLFSQWITMSAWNRCPVGRATQSGATNPIGIGAQWFRNEFFLKKPALERRGSQIEEYHPEDHFFVPAVYTDNPIYAKSKDFQDSLKQYPPMLRQALLEGRWDIALGSYYDNWDESECVYAADALEIKPWWPRWVSGDWGYEHDACFYWHTIDENGDIWTYREYVTNHEGARKLAESLIKCSEVIVDHESGKTEVEKLEAFYLSHDAFHHKDEHTIAEQMADVLRGAGLPEPVNAGTDKMGGEVLCKDRLGHLREDGTYHRRAFIADTCTRLIAVIPTAPRDEDKPEQIAKFLGDDPLDGWRHGIYGFLNQRQAPRAERVAQRMKALEERQIRDHGQVDITSLMIKRREIERDEQKRDQGGSIRPRRFRGSRI